MPGILFLHGGGHSDYTRYTKLIERFVERDILTHAFDHHADSLAGRLGEAERELVTFKKVNQLEDSDIFLWGSSMGGM